MKQYPDNNESGSWTMGVLSAAMIAVLLIMLLWSWGIFGPHLKTWF